jgi:hypothetical protein
MKQEKVLADLVVRRFGDRSEVSRIPLHNLSENHVDRVMSGMLINMDTDNYFIDDSEVDKARKMK